MFDSDAYDKRLRDSLLVFTDESNFPLYYNCSLGRDRTGTLTYLLMGLCGIDEHDLYTDVVLTFLSDKGSPDNTSVDAFLEAVNKFRDILASYKDPNLSLSENIEAYMLHLGLTKSQIESIKTNLLEDCG